MNFFKSFFGFCIRNSCRIYFYRPIINNEYSRDCNCSSSSESVPIEISENSILELDLDRPMFDNVGATQDFEEALGLGDDVLKFYEVVLAIRKAAKDDKIKGIDLKTMFPNMGWSQAQSIRKALAEFKAEGNLFTVLETISLRRATTSPLFQIQFFFTLWAEWNLKALQPKSSIIKTFKMNMALRWK